MGARKNRAPVFLLGMEQKIGAAVREARDEKRDIDRTNCEA
jgi:hypothetical protein